jgi:hypothetical protein
MPTLPNASCLASASGNFYQTPVRQQYRLFLFIEFTLISSFSYFLLNFPDEHGPRQNSPGVPL